MQVDMISFNLKNEKNNLKNDKKQSRTAGSTGFSTVLMKETYMKQNRGD